MFLKSKKLLMLRICKGSLFQSQWRKFTFFGGGGGGRSLLNFRQNFQISDNPSPFALEKAVFSPFIGQNFRKFGIFYEGGGGGGISATVQIVGAADVNDLSPNVFFNFELG